MSRVRTFGVLTALALITAQLAVFPASVGASSGTGLHPQSTGSHTQVSHPGKNTKATKATKKSSKKNSKKNSKKSAKKGSSRVSAQVTNPSVQFHKWGRDQFGTHLSGTATFCLAVGTSPCTATSGPLTCTVTIHDPGFGNLCRIGSLTSGATYTACESANTLTPAATYVASFGPNAAHLTPGCFTFTEGNGRKEIFVKNVAEITGTVQICKTFVGGTFPAGTVTITATAGATTGSVTFNTSQTGEVCHTINATFAVNATVSLTETNDFGGGFTSNLPPTITIAAGVNTLHVVNTLGAAVGTVQICKIGVGFVNGTQFSFTVTNGGTAITGSPFTITLGTTPNNCVTIATVGTGPGQLASGTQLVVTETGVAATTTVGFALRAGSAGSLSGTTATSTTLTLGGGSSVLDVTNTSTGTIRICKTFLGDFPAGLTITITATQGTTTGSVTFTTPQTGEVCHTIDATFVVGRVTLTETAMNGMTPFLAFTNDMPAAVDIVAGLNTFHVVNTFHRVVICKIFDDFGSFPSGTWFRIWVSSDALGFNDNVVFHPSGDRVCFTIDRLIPIGTVLHLREEGFNADNSPFTDFDNDMPDSVTVDRTDPFVILIHNRIVHRIRICKITDGFDAPWSFGFHVFVGDNPVAFDATVRDTDLGDTPVGLHCVILINPLTRLPLLVPVRTPITVQEMNIADDTDVSFPEGRDCDPVALGCRRFIMGTGLTIIVHNFRVRPITICKVAGTGVTSGTFDFRVAGVTPFGPIVISDVPVTVGNCVTVLRRFVVGTPVTVTETTPGFTVTEGNPQTQIVRADRTLNTFTFTNNLPTTTGFIEVCKETSADLTLPLTFSFTSPAFTGTQTVTVQPGATQPVCTLPIQVTAGTVAVTEAATAGTALSGARTVPAGAFIGLTGSTASFTVVAGTAETATHIIFRNVPAPVTTGTLKICKVLATGTTVPAGTLFTFSVGGTQTVSVAPGTCALVPGVPTGPITVAETGPAGYVVTDITFLAGTGTTNLGAGSAVATIVANQTTEVQFTNAASTGVIEICKETTGGLTGTFSFTGSAFTGTQSVTVAAGATQPVCSSPLTVASGTMTITEAAGAGFTLDGVRTATGAGTIVGVTGQTATVNIPAGTPEQMTQIIFHNVPVGTIICTLLGFSGNRVSLGVQASLGIASIVSTANTSGFTVTIPDLTGHPTSATVTAVIDPGVLFARLEVRVTDVQGNFLVCDPTRATIHSASGTRSAAKAHATGAQVFRGIAGSERYFLIKNGTPGLRTLRISVNHHPFIVSGLRPGENRMVDIKSALHAGKNNVVSVLGSGNRRGTADILISDSMPATTA